MHWTGWIVFVLVLAVGGWMAYDGGHALLTGDYLTATTGPHAGELGPWAELVQLAGIEPRSRLMRIVMTGYGLAAVLCALGFILDLPLAWGWQLVIAILGLWFLPIGTLANGIVIVLLLFTPLRRMARRTRASGVS